ncbi:hypothetical protein TNCV_4000701 [Trichonephila clavipes]|nr:hypothetical protein TNCV_4000701 [Trichonephila clavipes]
MRVSFHVEIVEVKIGGVAIYRPFGEFCQAKSYCHLYGAQDQRLVPCHDEFRGPRSDYVRQDEIGEPAIDEMYNHFLKKAKTWYVEK